MMLICNARFVEAKTDAHKVTILALAYESCN